MFCKYHKIAASPTANIALCGLPANLHASKHMTARRPTKWKYKNINCQTGH